MPASSRNGASLADSWSERAAKRTARKTTVKTKSKALPLRCLSIAAAVKSRANVSKTKKAATNAFTATAIASYQPRSVTPQPHSSKSDATAAAATASIARSRKRTSGVPRGARVSAAARASPDSAGRILPVVMRTSPKAGARAAPTGAACRRAAS